LVDRNSLEALVSAGKSQRELAAAMRCSQSTIKHWLKKYGLRTHAAWGIPKEVTRPTPLRSCRLCEKVRHFKGYLCASCRTRVRRMRNKLAAIEYLGGKCSRCSWTGLPAGFDFHHVNGDDKEFQIGNAANISWDRLTKELDKCELLCKSCHSIAHSKHDDERLMREVLNYRRPKSSMA